MSVYTTVTIDHLSQLLSGYSIGTPTTLEGIAAGVVNTNYRLLTTRGGYILTLIENPEHAKDLPVITALLAHLAARGIPCPRPVADHSGTIIQTVQGKPALIVTLLAGEHPLPITPHHALQAGRLLGELHLAGEDFPHHRPNPLGPETWDRLLTQLAATAPGPMVELLRSQLGPARELLATTLPTGVCHADLFPDNTLFSGDHLSGVIDFHYFCTAPWVYDLAIMVNAWGFTPSGAPDPERIAALLAGYRKVRDLTPAERQLFTPALRCASLRFATTRLHAATFPRPGTLVTSKPPAEYLERLRFHLEHELAAE